MKKRNKSYRARLTSRQTLLSLRWRRFSCERTPKGEVNRLYDLLGNHVSSVVPAPCSLDQVVTTICKQAQTPIRIVLLSPQLRKPVLSRGVAVFGSVWNKIDEIARNYPNMEWWISEHGLTMDTVIPNPPPADFYQIAGRLLFEMRKKFPEQIRFSRDQYLEITDQLQNFKPLDLLPKDCRRKIVEWNQQHGSRAIQSFSQGIAAKQPKCLHRQIMKLLYRAHDKFKRQQRDRLRLSS